MFASRRHVFVLRQACDVPFRRSKRHNMPNRQSLPDMPHVVSTDLMPVNADSVAGTVPVIWFELKSRNVRADSREMAEGMEPHKPTPDSSRVTRFGSAVTTPQSLDTNELDASDRKLSRQSTTTSA